MPIPSPIKIKKTDLANNYMNLSIPLKPFKYNKVTLVDESDFEYLSQFTWHILRTGYVIRRVYHGYTDKKQNKFDIILMHREIMKAPKGMEVDHINQDPLDNRRSNLRLATHKQNMQNRPMQRNNKSGYVGVAWKKDRNKWRAEVRTNGKSLHLGYFDDLQEAITCRDTRVKELHGEFAVLNGGPS